MLFRSGQQAPWGQPERGREPVRSVVGAGGEDARHGDGVHGQVGAAVGDGLTGGLGGERDRVDQIVAAVGDLPDPDEDRSEEHTSELQSLMRISYAVFCLNKKKNKK